MEGGGGGGVRVGGLIGVGRVVHRKSGVFTEVGSGQPGKSMLRGWDWTVRELGAYQYHHHIGIRVPIGWL